MNITIERLYKSEDQRSKLVKINILLGVLVRGISIIASLLLVPLTINYVSSELYGIWLTLSSVIQWMGFFDIGFGNGLRNRLGESIALGKYKKGRLYVSTTYAALTIIFSIIGGILFISSSAINWSSVLNVSQNYNLALVSVAQILIVAVSCQMVLKLIQNVIQAYQMNAFATFLDTVGNILSLLFIYLLTITMAPDLSKIAFVFSFVPIIVLLFSSILLYSTKFKKVRPDIGYIKMKYAKDIFNLGGEFFIIQIASLVLYQMINILISRICGPEEVTNYNIAYKYMSILLMATTIVMAPIWSAFTDAYTKQDVVWMKNIYGKLVRMFFLSILVAVFMFAISPFVYRIWIGDGADVTLITSALVGIYIIIGVWGQIHSMILNGMGKIRFQLLYSIVIMILFIPLALFWGYMFKLPGILMAMIIVNAPGLFFGRYQVLGLMNKNVTGIWTK